MDSAALKKLQVELASQLPLSSRWIINGTPMDWNFSRVQQDLRPLGKSEVSGGYDIPESWSLLYLFGESDYAEGGGSHSHVGIHIQTGAVCGLDIEREDQSVVYLLNSCVEKFIGTFLALNEAFHKRTEPHTDFFAKLETIDPDVFPQSEWALYVEMLSERA